MCAAYSVIIATVYLASPKIRPLGYFEPLDTSLVRTVQELLEQLDEARTTAFLDGLTLGRLERQRREEDFPELTPELLSMLDGLYPDEDELA